ncbi:MAG TPA: hypothetical protein VN958_09505 [Chitinophagaceae bacterium]|nr:hypothetical protein [Chitinophagaceae bacterium]
MEEKKRTIKIFKTFEEQEQYDLDLMGKTTPLQRFQSLYRMQQWTRLFHPAKDKSRKIIIGNGHSQ